LNGYSTSSEMGNKLNFFVVGRVVDKHYLCPTQLVIIPNHTYQSHYTKWYLIYLM